MQTEQISNTFIKVVTNKHKYKSTILFNRNNYFIFCNLRKPLINQQIFVFRQLTNPTVEKLSLKYKMGTIFSHDEYLFGYTFAPKFRTTRCLLAVDS